MKDQGPEAHSDDYLLGTLAPKQRAFVVEYLKDRNGTQAAVRAGYSPRSAGQQASTLLKNQKVSGVLEELSRRAEVAAVQGVAGSKQELIEILWKLARTGKSETAQISAVRTLAPTYDLVVDAPRVTNENFNRDVPAGDAELASALQERGFNLDAIRPSRKNVIKLKNRRAS